LPRESAAPPDTPRLAGAALGAVLAITFHLDFSLLGVSAVPLASFAGSFGALGIVYALSVVRRRGTSTMVLLLAGVTLTALLGAVVRFVQYIADFTETFQTVRWLMGSLDVAAYAPIGAALVPMTAAFGGFVTLPRALDLISVGAESAAARGVDVAPGGGAGVRARHRCRRVACPSVLLSARRPAPGAAYRRPITGWCFRRRRCSGRPSDRLRFAPNGAGAGGKVGTVTAMMRSLSWPLRRG
jgi:hypothetical protein